ncbi:prepilin-type N-terminal cleavage/methylation domain-containing protein [Aliibacillus thermotolerans]|uniref:Prepilin-type N-terminal cleavage/methylation domain-containing protein n=1 Tax=Aliibacillus thermotolerans TaxID=1834418 RepID=A0ABW0U6T5_9BACI|nr:prepilin-type N-terminal cleavage/methylation domain-containing protein [Aliibacillus thermotolerans]MDA3131105.1 hypothetical protein [Aliibacillus thermotolerans]
MNNEKGLTLIEAVATLSLITFVATILLPIYSALLLEKQTLSETRVAYELLEREALQGEIEKKEEKIHIEKMDTEYVLHKNVKKEGVDICVRWRGANKRQYETCLFVWKR